MRAQDRLKAGRQHAERAERERRTGNQERRTRNRLENLFYVLSRLFFLSRWVCLGKSARMAGPVKQVENLFHFLAA
jgi:hypothetical protein